jgi:endoglucanase Acf2
MKLHPLIAVVLLSASLASLANDLVQVGQGGWRKTISSGDNAVPPATFRTPAMQGRAAPTNQWYSSVMFTRWSEVLHAIPLTAKASPRGLEVGYAQKTIVPTERKDVEVHYPHVAAVTLRPLGFEPQAALLAGYSDWAVDIAFEAQGQSMTTTVAHGSPFVYAKLSHGNVAIDLAKGLTATVWAEDVRVLVISTGQQTYAAFAPTAAQWQQVAGVWQLNLNAGKRYVSLAVLPNAEAATLRQFLAQAYTHIVDTRADFQIDRNSSEVITQFKLKTQTLEGPQGTGIMGLYPHHWHNNKALPSNEVGRLNSIRGDIRLFASGTFETRHRHTGFVPFWPGVQGGEQAKAIRGNLSKETSRARRMMLEIGQGPYWQGKGLQRITQLMSVADVQGETAIRDELLALTKGRFEQWLSGTSQRTYFHYSPVLGTVVSYPEEYDAVKDMNDHHFHYGYWIRAAADIGLRDPQWIRPERWGGMIDLLVADIATNERGRPDFPYLRNFDPYEGHSWASGVSLSPDGNNQESSSEAVNAWAALMVWGALQNKPELVELGTYLYTTEIQAINHYWFDIHGLTLPKEYQNVEVSMLFGGKSAHNTWWIDEPRQIHGINLLPLTAASTYLAQSPVFVKNNLQALAKETKIYESRGKQAKPEDIWQDLFAKYLALVDPVAGLARWDVWGSVELGDTRTHAQHWLSFLQQVGAVDLSVSANTPFHAVFQQAGKGRTYLVYNASAQEQQVRFSDGVVVLASPKGLSVKRP